MIRICTVVIGNTLDEFLKNLSEIQKVSKFVELRVDYIKNLSLDDIKIIKEKTYRKCIFTCRSIEEGGKFNKSTQELLNIIESANGLKFDYIDIEHSKLQYINFKKQCKIIGSYHNFQNTPNYNELLNIYKSIKKFKMVDIVKIATMVMSDNDNIELARLLINNKDIIALGMGEKGKITRIISPLLGGYLTFASVGNNTSASGQISLNELIKIYGEKYEWK